MTEATEGEDARAGKPGQRARKLARQLRQAELRLAEAENLHAVLTRARNAYIADLKAEIVHHRSGVDLGSLLDGD